MCNIDQRVRSREPHIGAITALDPVVIGDWEFVTLPPQGSAMREYQPVSPPHLSAIERPRCLACDHQRMLLSKIEGGIFDSSRKRTLACRPLNFLRLSKIDQHPAPGAAQTTHHRSANGISSVTESSVTLPPHPTGGICCS